MKSVSLVLCIQSQFIQHKNLGSEKIGMPKIIIRTKEPNGMSQNEYLYVYNYMVFNKWNCFFDNFIIFPNYWIIELK